MRATQTWQPQSWSQSIARDGHHKWFRSLTEVLQARETSCAEELKGAKKIDELKHNERVNERVEGDFQEAADEEFWVRVKQLSWTQDFLEDEFFEAVQAQFNCGIGDCFQGTQGTFEAG